MEEGPLWFPENIHCSLGALIMGATKSHACIFKLIIQVCFTF